MRRNPLDKDSKTLHYCGKQVNHWIEIKIKLPITVQEYTPIHFATEFETDTQNKFSNSTWTIFLIAGLCTSASWSLITRSLVTELHHLTVPVSSQAQMWSQVSYFHQLSYLGQKPGVILDQSLPVSFCCHVSIAEAVLYGGCSANVFVKEFLPRLLGDGFGWHGAARWLKMHCREKRHSNSLTISHWRPINEQQPFKIFHEHAAGMHDQCNEYFLQKRF